LVMWRRTGCIAILIAAGAGCGSGKGSGGTAGTSGPGTAGTGSPGAAGSGNAGGSSGGASGHDGGTDAPPDGTGFEPFVPDYYVGSCSFIGGAGTVPDAGSPLHGLTVVATGLTGMVALEADATNAYLAGASTISRLPLAGGTPTVMVVHAAPVATAADANNIYWSDSSVSGQTTILRAPLTATGFEAFVGDGAAAQTATTIVSKPGAPGAFTMAGGTIYFAAGSAVWRVPTAGGSAQMVYSPFAPTGIAVDGDNVYLGDDPNEAIQFVSVSGQFAGVLQGFALSNATPRQLAVSNGILYWGDWFGSIEHAPVANPNSLGYANTPCGGAGCYPNKLRPAGAGVAWEAGDDNCGNVGTADATGSKYFAVSIAPVGGIAVAGNYLYAVTGVGQLLRFDLP
jgi:hypothetical protein